MSGSGLRVQIDGRNVQVPAGSTLLDAAKRADVSIPTLCHRDGCRPGTSCMVCVVQVQGLKRLVPACAYPVRDGMVVETGTERVLQARRTAMELLLAEHVGDCEGPCRRGCPARMNIPLMLRQIAAGRIDRALVTVRREIPMPAVLGWVCPAPCEKHCRRTGVDAPVAICLAKRFAGEKGGGNRVTGVCRRRVPEAGGLRSSAAGLPVCPAPCIFGFWGIPLNCLRQGNSWAADCAIRLGRDACRSPSWWRISRQSVVPVLS